MKALTFEEWEDKFDISEKQHWGEMLDVFNAARQGMIPEDGAVRIPPVSEWPGWAVAVDLSYVGVRDYTNSRQVMSIASFPRPTPAWTPKVGDAAFLYDGPGQDIRVVRVTDVLEKIAVVATGYGTISDCYLSDIKPFSPEKIGLPWDQI